MKKFIALIVVLAIAGSGWWYYSQGTTVAVNPYRFVSVERGDLESVVSATGNLSAITTVQVGTQVSGIVNKIFADFNDKVQKGQLVAMIDTTLLAASVRESEANVERNQAQLAHAQREYDRIKILHDSQAATKVEFNQAQYNLDLALANIKSARISLERANRNLGYATIYSPISGIVIERNVDVGQTVASSLQAPQLFLIANDLSQMQIETTVDESDIGLIEEGQDVRFTVQAYPDDTFLGVVRQVRLQSTVQESVVNYTVVVDVQNDDGKLLPGMTATVEFLISRATDVLKLPNAALRFRPTASMMEQLQAQRESRMENLPDSVRDRFAERQGQRGERGGGDGQGGFGGRSGGPGGFGGGSRGSEFAMLWYFNEEGELAMLRTRTGLSDGQMTEIQGRFVEEGMQIIVGVTQSADGEEGAFNPFQQNQQQGGFRRGAF